MSSLVFVRLDLESLKKEKHHVYLTLLELVTFQHKLLYKALTSISCVDLNISMSLQLASARKIRYLLVLWIQLTTTFIDTTRWQDTILFRLNPHKSTSTRHVEDFVKFITLPEHAFVPYIGEVEFTIPWAFWGREMTDSFVLPIHVKWNWFFPLRLYVGISETIYWI